MKKKIALGLLIVATFLVGFRLGARNVILNQTIYNQENDCGVYLSEYKGQVHEYYYGE